MTDIREAKEELASLETLIAEKRAGDTEVLEDHEGVIYLKIPMAKGVTEMDRVENAIKRLANHSPKAGIDMKHDTSLIPISHKKPNTTADYFIYIECIAINDKMQREALLKSFRGQHYIEAQREAIIQMLVLTKSKKDLDQGIQTNWQQYQRI